MNYHLKSLFTFEQQQNNNKTKYTFNMFKYNIDKSDE